MTKQGKKGTSRKEEQGGRAEGQRGRQGKKKEGKTKGKEDKSKDSMLANGRFSKVSQSCGNTRIRLGPLSPFPLSLSIFCSFFDCGTVALTLSVLVADFVAL